MKCGLLSSEAGLCRKIDAKDSQLRPKFTSIYPWRQPPEAGDLHSTLLAELILGLIFYASQLVRA